MKTYCCFNHNRLLSGLRFATALLFVCFATIFISARTAAVAGEMVPFNGTVSGYGSFLTLPHVVNSGHANQLGAFTRERGILSRPARSNDRLHSLHWHL